MIIPTSYHVRPLVVLSQLCSSRCLIRLLRVRLSVLLRNPVLVTCLLQEQRYFYRIRQW